MHLRHLITGNLAVLVTSLSPPAPLLGASDLPIVDLGYAAYRPTTYNVSRMWHLEIHQRKIDNSVQQSGQYFNFSNIRYAAPPLRNLRFRDPQPPLWDRKTGVLDGTKAFICPQAAPASWNWDNTGLPGGQVIPIGNSTLPESEDCLFLDVVVPVSVYENRQSTLAPVLVNIHGGGFFIGDKATLYPPQGLMEASKNQMIYVSMNYRVRWSL